MTRISRYVGTTVAGAILLVLAVIVGLDIIAGIIDELEDIQGNYTFFSACLYVLMTVPSRIYNYLPFASLIGCLAGLGVLATSSELVVIRASGVHIMRLVWMVLKPTLILTLGGLLIAEFVSPRSQQLAEAYRDVALQKDHAATTRYGVWHREGGTFMHFAAVQPSGVLLGVTLYDFDKARNLRSSVYAEQAIYQGDTWVLEDVQSARFTDNQAIKTTELSRNWDTELNPRLLGLLVLEADQLSMSGLWDYSKYLTTQGINSDEYRLAFWNKVLQPFSILALVVVAISFVFGPLRSVTMGQRLFTGIMVGVVFRTMQDMLGPASLVFHFPPVLAALVPISLCLLLGFWLLWRKV